MENIKLKVYLKVNEMFKMYCKNIKRNDKIINYQKLLKNSNDLYVPMPWVGYYYTNRDINRTCQKKNIFQ